MTSEERQAVRDNDPHLSLERRGAPRLAEPFPALVRGRPRSGRPFEEELTLDNLSAHGMHLRLRHMATIGDLLFVIVRFTLGATLQTPGPGVAIRGIVLRSKRQKDGHYAVALVFIRHRLLFAPEETP